MKFLCVFKNLHSTNKNAEMMLIIFTWKTKKNCRDWEWNKNDSKNVMNLLNETVQNRKNIKRIAGDRRYQSVFWAFYRCASHRFIKLNWKCHLNLLQTISNIHNIFLCYTQFRVWTSDDANNKTKKIITEYFDCLYKNE